MLNIVFVYRYSFINGVGIYAIYLLVFSYYYKLGTIESLVYIVLVKILFEIFLKKGLVTDVNH